MNPGLHMPELNQLLMKLNDLILNKNKSVLKKFFPFIRI